MKALSSKKLSLKRQGLSALPFSFRLFTSLMLCVIALCYASLLYSIYQDTEMQISYIIEGYGGMGDIELTHHTFKYMYWFVGIFTITTILFLLTEVSEKMKIIFAWLIPALITLDIGSAWLIRHNPAFAWMMYGSGMLLVISFIIMFNLIQIDLWKKSK